MVCLPVFSRCLCALHTVLWESASARGSACPQGPVHGLQTENWGEADSWPCSCSLLSCFLWVQGMPHRAAWPPGNHGVRRWVGGLCSRALLPHVLGDNRGWVLLGQSTRSLKFTTVAVCNCVSAPCSSFTLLCAHHPVPKGLLFPPGWSRYRSGCQAESESDSKQPPCTCECNFL